MHKIIAVIAVITASPACAVTQNSINVLPDGVTPSGTLANPVFTTPSVGSIVQLTGQSLNLAATAGTAVLGAAPGQTTYISGFEVTGTGATAASNIQVTITGALGATPLVYVVAVPAGVNTSITPLIVEFTIPIAAYQQNATITVNVPSFGIGNTNAAVVSHGFRQ